MILNSPLKKDRFLHRLVPGC